MKLWYFIRRRKAKMKNERRHGKSARNGNAPAPYTKYKKKPYTYQVEANTIKAARAGVSYWEYVNNIRGKREDKAFKEAA